MPDMVDRPDIVRDNPQVPHNHSTFNLKELRLTTEQFGYVKPHFVIDDVSSDDFEYRPQYKTKSYTLRAPLMQDVHRKLSYVKVDLSCILPFNFEKFYTNPVIGDDVPIDTGCVVEHGYNKIKDAVLAALGDRAGDIQGVGNFTDINITGLFKALVFAELFYSRGSLLSSLGSHNSAQFSSYDGQIYLDFDSYFDGHINHLQSLLLFNQVAYLIATIDGVTKNVVINSSDKLLNDPGSISFREFLCYIRETGDWFLQGFRDNSGIAVDLSGVNYNYNPPITITAEAGIPFNFSRLCAYQLACAEYMTNDKVDHIYSAELYRQYMSSLVRDFAGWLGDSYPFYFTINGYPYQYDFLSGNYLVYLLDKIAANGGRLNRASALQYFISLFGFRRSLRYKDYFVSSRVRPLAVGNVDVAVNANKVSVIDISKNIQVQRFLNAVNHSGRRLSNYIKTLFGNDIRPDRHVPQWLADIDELVYTSEVENTGAAQQTAQNSVTAVFTGNSGNKVLKFYADLPGFIIGLTSYDIERAYPDGIDRSFFIKDRFDMFIPEMQFIGDQSVFIHELRSNDASAFGTPFGYQYRDMQYKLFHAVADGGFVRKLPGYAFLFNKRNMPYQNVSPDFIRSMPYEIDDLYLSLTGYSLGNYFHFISLIENNVTAKRPMIANPKILE